LQCIGFEKIKSNQIKSKIFKDLIGFEKFFNSKILFGFALIFVKNPNQTKSNKKKGLATCCL
jgi:hypothetical protein